MQQEKERLMYKGTLMEPPANFSCINFAGQKE